MTVDQRAKVVSLSSKHEPHQLSIFDFHVLRSQLFRVLPVSDELYRSSREKFHALSNSSEAGAVCGHSASSQGMTAAVLSGYVNSALELAADHGQNAWTAAAECLS